MSKIQKISKDFSIEVRKSLLEKLLKKYNNKLKKYTKENNQIWILKTKYTIYDLEEQLKELK